MKKLKGDYKKIKDKQLKTEEERKEWDYFEAMDSVLGHKPATHPSMVIDTSASKKEKVDTVKGGNSKSATKADAATESKQGSDTTVDDSSKESQAATVEGDKEAVASKTTKPSGAVQSSSTVEKKEKKTIKRTAAERQVESFQSVLTNVLDKLINCQSKSEEKLLELEEKRLKLENEQKQQARKEELEEQRERRSFQLAMMQMLQGQSSTPSFSAVQMPSPPFYMDTYNQ